MEQTTSHYAPSCLSHWVGSTSFYNGQCYCEHLSTCVLPMHRGSSHYLHRRVMFGSWGNKLFIDLDACHCVQSITLTLPSAVVPTLYAISSRHSVFILWAYGTHRCHTMVTKRLDFGARLKSRPTLSWTWGV